MYCKLFAPVFFLMFFQIIGYIFYQGFKFYPKPETYTFVLSIYIYSIFLFFAFCFFFDEKQRCSNELPTNNIFNVIVVIAVILFLIKPSIIMVMMGLQYGFDYVRQNFFGSDLIRAAAFGSVKISAFTLMYLVPIFWGYVIYLIGNKKRSNVFIMYFLLISLIFFNLSYAGRFNIYFAFIFLYLKSILEGFSFIRFCIKYLPIISILFFVSMFVVNIRNNKEGLVNDSNGFIKLLEYHIMQPNFLSQKIEDGSINNENYPFKTIIESLFYPIYNILGKSFSDISYGYYSTIFGNPTLYSNLTDTSYNAYSTFFIYLYADFYYFAYIALLFIIFIFFSISKLLNRDLRIRYVSYMSLMFYFSLFQAPIFSPGALFVLLVFPFIYKFFRKS